MAQKPNYDFERRERERQKAAKKAQRAAAKEAAKAAASGNAEQPTSDAQAPRDTASE